MIESDLHNLTQVFQNLSVEQQTEFFKKYMNSDV
jgi:hypothetical protein